MRFRYLTLLLFICTFPLPHTALASDIDVGRVVFDEVTRRLIHEYYGVPYHGGGYKTDHPGKGKGKGKNKGGSPPPGLAKRATLPPGLQRQLDEKGRLPPGLQGRGLPDDLEGRLPRLRSGTRRVIVDRDVLLIEAATGLVLDVILDVVRH